MRTLFSSCSNLVSCSARDKSESGRRLFAQQPYTNPSLCASMHLCTGLESSVVETISQVYEAKRVQIRSQLEGERLKVTS